MDYNVTASILWNLPCNTNGNFDHFILMINGTPNFTTNGVHHQPVQENVTVERNDPIENIVYQHNIVNVQASYEYSITVIPVLVGGTQGESEEVVFISPDGCK